MTPTTLDQTKERNDQLMSLAQNGDMAAFDALITENEPHFKGVLARYIVLDEHDLKDVLQKSYIKAWARISQFEGANVFSWFVTNIHRTALDFVRNRQRFASRNLALEDFRGWNQDNEDFNYERLGEASYDKNTPDLPILNRELGETIAKSISELPPLHNKVFDYIFNQNLTYQQTATKMGVNLGTIMSRVYYLRRKLQESIKEKLYV